MATVPQPTPTVSIAPPLVRLPTNCPLEVGDRLDRAEFERRWEQMPYLKRAELIDGVVYTNAAAVSIEHGEGQNALGMWLGVYSAMTPGVSVAIDTSMRLDDQNMLQPDGLLRIESSRHAQTSVDTDGMLVGAPELVVEIATSSVSRNLHQKYEAYRRHGVREYIVHRTRDEALDWFELRGEQYVPLAPDADGIHRSKVFPGLWLDAAALLRGDQARVLAVLNQGLASAEHQAAVERWSR